MYAKYVSRHCLDDIKIYNKLSNWLKIDNVDMTRHVLYALHISIPNTNVAHGSAPSKQEFDQASKLIVYFQSPS